MTVESRSLANRGRVKSRSLASLGMTKGSRSLASLGITKGSRSLALLGMTGKSRSLATLWMTGGGRSLAAVGMRPNPPHRRRAVYYRFGGERWQGAFGGVDEGDEGAAEQNERRLVRVDEQGEEAHRMKGNVTDAVVVQVVAAIRVPVVP